MLRPGSFAWLVGHDLKLGFLRMRAMFGDARPRTVAAIVVASVSLFHLLAWPAAAWFVSAAADSEAGGLHYPALA